VDGRPQLQIEMRARLQRAPAAHRKRQQQLRKDHDAADRHQRKHILARDNSGGGSHHALHRIELL
jgi:hypothetical protein